MAINSCLYQMKLWHDRHQPKRYKFTHDIFMFYIDLDEIDILPTMFGLIGHCSSRVYDFREEDHIHTKQQSLKEHIRAYAASKGVTQAIDKVFLLTNLRIVGYVFNPVSFYYCYDAQGNSVCVVVEIGNTFSELKYFFLSPSTKKDKSFLAQEIKYYYISPFTDMDNTLDFNVQEPGDDVHIEIDVLKNGAKFFYSGMRGKKIPLTTGNLCWMTLRFPLMTLKVIALIHWHAMLLYLGLRLGFHAKDETPQLQQNVYRSWKKTSIPMKE